MSVDIMTRIWWREDLATMEKLVALAIADAASDEGVAWPAVETIARKASVSPRTVQNAIRSLAGKMLLRIVERKNRSSYYVFNLPNLPHVERERPRKEQGPLDLTGAGDSPVLNLRVQEIHPTGARGSATGAGGAPRNVMEPSEETIPPSPDGEGTPTDEIDLFGDTIPADLERPLEDRVAEAWHTLTAEIPTIGDIQLLGDDRRRKIGARASAAAKQLGITPWAAWERIFDAIRRSTWLKGLEPPGRNYSKPFKLTLDHVLRPSEFQKILEGAYDDRSGTGQHKFDPSTGRRFGPSEQAGRSVLERRRARRAQSQQPGDNPGSSGQPHAAIPYHPR
ncbi:helix-turn-helix domain-containing protein [Rhizorhabdus sp.]|uniref:helix-turn-helix domain-containing protein n=1 Tax=Rhizorhabdus sp. TaxID=1968843 RepID=UPI0035B447D0